MNNAVLGWVVSILGVWACVAYTWWHLPVAGKMVYQDKMVRGGIFIFMVNIIISTQFSLHGGDFGLRRPINALCFCMIAVGLTILMIKFRKVEAPVLAVPSVGVLRAQSILEKENNMATKAVYLTFAKAALLRAARTFLQAFLASGAVTAIAAGVFDWETIGQAALTGLGGAALSVLLSLKTGLPEADTTVQGSTIVSLGRHATPDA